MTDESRDALNAIVTSYRRSLEYHEGEANRAEQEMAQHRDAAKSLNSKVNAILADLDASG